MAQKGKLPGVKIGNQWRFHLAAIDDYLQGKIVSSSDEELDSIINTSLPVIPLSRFTSRDLIELDLEAKDANGVLDELAGIAYVSGLTSSKEELLGELKKRERMLSTAVGNCVALPHPRHPSTKLFKEPKIIIARSKSGIDFDAPDNKPVYIFFMICAPNECVHLRLLAMISKLLHIPNIIEKFMHAESKEQIIRILLEFEREKLFPNNKALKS
jgi:mannitol/fructose-specific phosphotransferase system IIA component (Ntr-type)